MKHDWEHLVNTQADVCQYGWEPRRRCRNCGKVQQRETEHSWMRVVKYQWWPLVGRCPGKPKRKKS
jgi:hypothetical protein